MKEITNILAAYDRLDFAERKAALATVVHVAGSSYRREGARMLIVDDGHWTGGISGGCLEDDAIRKANMAIFQQKPRVVRYDTTQDDPFQIGVGLGCKGIIDVLIEPVDASDPFNPVELLRSVAGQRGDAALGVVTASESPEVPVGLRILKTKNELVLNMTPLAGWERLTEEVLETLENGASRQLEMTWTDGQPVKFFVEMLPPPIHLVALGSNYDLLPLLEIGRTLGWQMSVVGNLRKIGKPIFELATVVAEFEQVPVPPDDHTATVLMSHDYKTDFLNLKKILPHGLPFIGLLGPRKRTERILVELKNEGIHLSPAQLEALHGPAGLDIGARTPEAIALSIAAEIQSVFGRRKGGPLRHRTAPIYDRKTVTENA
ncbi:MAG: XdhC family protein [Saprospiraceae bacterium]|nr:XdhC family protein [Saprospiraceae bacterium]MCF8252043.1 XdhC family protein [Saprospiraceae bacterium]MCF8281732.1 XdhC family protein [Bacteroidales bacterium]MCF8310380.1 XdhC family protein [Saprospiraceae bacterium]MCF8439758.1 XdhC family protein [Saprospiraceae bacterium]